MNIGERMQLLIETVSDYAIFLLSPEGRVETWNAGARALKGYEAGEIIGEPLTRFYGDEDIVAGLPYRLLREAEQQGRVENEGWRLRKDGSRFRADVIITAIRDKRGVLQGFAKVTRDLTDRWEAEERLRVSEERFRLLVEGVREYAIFMLDTRGIVATWNTGAERLKGYAAAEIIGAHFSVFYPAEAVRSGKAQHELEIAASEGAFEEEGWRVRKDGSLFWANIVIAAMRNSAGDLIGYAKITRDLTQRRRLEEERFRRTQAEETARLHEHFLSIASHELRTPLTALQLQLQSMVARVTDEAPALRPRLERALRSGERLCELIDALLDVSRLESGNLEIHPQPVDLTVTLHDVIERFTSAAASAGCELHPEIAPELKGSWDRLRIEQVVMNLLSNAMKFGVGQPIRISLEDAGSDAVLRIADRGPGIPPEDMERIFGRFERAASTSHHGGLGLGLYVTQEIVTLHGGAISVENLPDGGACFTVRLPFQAKFAPESEAR